MEDVGSERVLTDRALSVSPTEPLRVSSLPGDDPSRVIQRCINVLRGSLMAGAGPEARAQRDAGIAILETLL